MMEHFKVNIHSIVDVITNSSTTIFTYQNSVEETKELVQAVLNLCGIKDKTPDDIFYYGVFADKDTYLNYCDYHDHEDEEDEPRNMPQINAKYGTPEHKQELEIRKKWLNDLKFSIIKGETSKPKWMESAETCGDWAASSYLELIIKDEKFSEFAQKVRDLLNSVEADGGFDG
jgi:hypothetical protein